MAKVLWIVMLMVSSSATAMVWFRGSVVLISGTVVTGEIARQSDDLVILRSGGDITVLPAHKVSSYRFYDAIERINRKFVSMMSVGIGVRFQYFESVLTGALTVLRQQQQFSEKFDEARDGFRYYVHQGSDLSLLMHFKRKYYSSVRSSLEQQELDVSHLNLNEEADIIRLIQMFNQLPAGPIAAM